MLDLGLHEDFTKHVWMVDWKKYGLPHCSVYIIAPEGHWPCKIGISVGAKKRIQTLQTSHWKMLTVARCWWAPTVADARAVEKKAHELLKQDNCYLLGEWFDKTPDKAAEVVEFAALSVGVEIQDRITQEDIQAEIVPIMQDMERRFSHLKSMFLLGQDRDGLPIYDYTTGKTYK